MAYRIDFHLHSLYSPDGSLKDSDFKRVFDAGRLDLAVITDHDTIAGAVDMQSIFGDRIIIGEEITTAEGEIIGLYLSKLVKPGQTAKETVRAIRKQKGLVYIPHPFEKARKGLSEETLNSIANNVDIIEVVNGRSFSTKARRRAVSWAQKHDVAQAASSDAHGKIGWANVYTVLAEEPTRDTLVQLTKEATLQGNLNGLLSYAYPKLNRLRKRQGSNV